MKNLPIITDEVGAKVRQASGNYRELLGQIKCTNLLKILLSAHTAVADIAKSNGLSEKRATQLTDCSVAASLEIMRAIDLQLQENNVKESNIKDEIRQLALKPSLN